MQSCVARSPLSSSKHERAEALERAAGDVGSLRALPCTQDPEDESAHVDRIGPYRILGQIGEGGFGEVFLAEQREPIRRRVALKLIKPGMGTKEVIARFEAERHALALMDHPGIARVLDAGETEAGRAYFVMQYVQGIPITDFCDQHSMTLEGRIRLLIDVCHAIQHAHQKGVIHRDLKPSNILVTYADGRAAPKVIDFGIAKVLNQGLTARTLFTRHGQLIGTPTHMSPEQAGTSPLDVDTRSDIYSSGVLLYELLTGTLPFEPAALREAGLGEIQRILREVEPPRPSTRLGGLGGAGSKHARRRGTDARSLQRELEGDLDWITMRALEKNRARRYASASDLASDLRRHLADEPVEAGPPTASYRIAKFVRRNRVLVTAASRILLILSGALVAVSVSLDRAKDAETLAQERFEKQQDLTRAAQSARREAEAAREASDLARQRAERVSSFVRQVLLGVSPRSALGRDTTVLREMLDRAAGDIDAAELDDQPLIKAELHLMIGQAYDAIGEYVRAEPHLLDAHRLRAAELGQDDVQTLEAWGAGSDSREVLSLGTDPRVVRSDQHCAARQQRLHLVDVRARLADQTAEDGKVARGDPLQPRDRCLAIAALCLPYELGGGLLVQLLACLRSRGGGPRRDGLRGLAAARGGQAEGAEDEQDPGGRVLRAHERFLLVDAGSSPPPHAAAFRRPCDGPWSRPQGAGRIVSFLFIALRGSSPGAAWCSVGHWGRQDTAIRSTQGDGQ